MGVVAKIVDFNFLFNTSETLPILVNDFNVEAIEERERLNQMLHTHYDGDTLNIHPQCECGAISGEFNVGVVCPDCGVPVMAVTERPLESVLWVKPPQGVDVFINPQVWKILSDRMTHKGINILRWVCDPQMTIPSSVVAKLPKNLFSLPIERGINHFYRNFEQYMQLFMNEDVVVGTRHQKKTLWEFLMKWRSAIFATHLPVPSKLNFITEKTVTSTYVDTTMTAAVDAVWTISSTEHPPRPLSLRTRMSRSVKANMLLSEYYEKFISDILVGKKGWFRKHVFGSRLHFTARAVISSLSDNHRYDELHLPWSLSIMLFKIHLTSKLIKRGFTPNECTRLLHEHSVQYNPLIDELFQEMIRESPYDGIPVLLNRNPSLVRGSIQALRVTKIKTDTRINSISLSVLILKAFNADFDGDALNLTLILDDRMYRAAQRLAPHLGVLSLREPRALSKNITLPAPVVATISGFVHEGR